MHKTFWASMALLLAVLPCLAEPTSAPATAQAVRLIDLSQERIELSALAAISPVTTGTGGAISYLFADDAAHVRRAWVDLGVMRLDSDTNGLIGLSTTIPWGGVTLTDNARVGIGYCYPFDGFVAYVRTPFSF